MESQTKCTDQPQTISWFQRLKNWFRGEPDTPKPPPKPEEMGGGMVLSLDRVLQRLDDGVNLPTAVRANAMRSLADMSNKEVTLACSTGNLKRAKRVQEALNNVETKFPKVFNGLSQEDRSNIQSQRDRTTSRVARLENRLTNSNGESSRYGVVPNAATETRRNHLKGKG